MSVKKTDLEETEEERQQREEAEAAAEREAEEARQKELSEAREAKRQAELEAARAKGEAEALRKGSSQTNTGFQNVTEEQWLQAEQQMGKTRQQIIADYHIAQNAAAQATKPLMDELAQTRAEAKAAREETERLKRGRTKESVESSFYDQHPELKAHRKMVEEVVSEFGTDGDEQAHLRRLKIAADVVRGRVKEMRGNKSGSGETGSGARMEVNNDKVDDGREIAFDPKGTGNAGAAQLMESVHRGFGRGLRHDDAVDYWKKSRDEEDRGVAISMDEDLAIARSRMGLQKVGGKDKGE